MNCWWVNQGQTHEFEVIGGFLWSPKTDVNGKRRQAYENMSLIKSGDLIFSHFEKAIRAIGFAESEALTLEKPDFRSKGSNWADIGWYVPVKFELLDNPILDTNIFPKIKDLLPTTHSPFDKNGKAVMSYLFSIDQNVSKILISESNFSLEELQNESNYDESDFYDRQLPDLVAQRVLNGPTSKTAIVESRRGQNLFRANLLKFESACRFTGISDSKHLIASHIKPWRDSSDAERIDGENGFLLSHHVDHLFNDGYISFDDFGNLIISSQLSPEILTKLHINPTRNVGDFTKNQKKYLSFHRSFVFKE